MAEWLSVGVPENTTSRLQPANPVPKLVIVAVPVTVTRSPSELARSVVDAAGMVEVETAFVLRMIAA